MVFQMRSLQQFDNVNRCARILPHTATQSNGTSQPSFSFKNKLKIESCLKQPKVLTSVLDKVATSSYLEILITNLCVFSEE